MKNIQFLILLFSALNLVFGDFWDEPVPAIPEAEEQLMGSWNEEVEASAEPTFLVTLLEKNRKQQWILRVGFGPDPEVRDEKLEKRTLYASTGASVEFSSAKRPMHIELMGPAVTKKGKWSRASKIKSIKSIDFTVPADYLALGFFKAAELTTVLKEEGKAAKFFLEVAHVPFPEDQIRPIPQNLFDAGVNEKHIEALISTSPALFTYFGVVMGIEPLADVLKSLIDRPSVFSILTKGVGFGIVNHGEGISRFDGSKWDLSDERSYYQFPITLEINEKPGLWVNLIVIDTKPPLEACAGVVGIVASPPDDPDRQLIIHLLN